MHVDAIPKPLNALLATIPLRGTVQYDCNFLPLFCYFPCYFIYVNVYFIFFPGFQVHLLKTESSTSKSNKESLGRKQIRNTTTIMCSSGPI